MSVNFIFIYRIHTEFLGFSKHFLRQKQQQQNDNNNKNSNLIHLF